MDQNIPLNFFTVYEPRVDINNDMIAGNYAIVKGGEVYTYYNYTANSSSNTGANWSTTPPGTEIVLSRLIELDLPVRLDFAGPGSVAGTESMIMSNLDAFRAFPIETITKNMICTINGFDININMSNVVHPLSRYYLDIERLNEGITPNMLDNWQSYSDGDGNAKNPLAWYDNSAQNPRGAYNSYDIVNNTNTAATIQARLKSYVMVAPFEWLSARNNDVPGLTKLDTLEWNLTFVNNLQRIWSRSDAHPVPITSLSVTIGEDARMNLLWITPRYPERERIRSMPELKYPYYRTVRYDTYDTRVYNPNDIINDLASQVISLSSIPRALYVYLHENETDVFQTTNSNVQVPDVYQPITNINITWNNTAGVLSSATQNQLYSICVKNGLRNTTYNEFIGFTNAFNQLALPPNTPVGKLGLCSAPIRLEPGIDWTLEQDEAPGVSGKYNLQVTISGINANQNRPLRVQLSILIVYEGYLSIAKSRCFGYDGPIRPEDVINTPVNRSISWHDLEKNFGGSLGQKFKTIGRDVNKFLRDSKAISKGFKVASYLPTRASSGFRAVSDVAKQFGYGMDMGGCDGGMLDEHYQGGRKLTKAEMKRRLKY